VIKKAQGRRNCLALHSEDVTITHAGALLMKNSLRMGAIFSFTFILSACLNGTSHSPSNGRTPQLAQTTPTIPQIENTPTLTDSNDPEDNPPTPQPLAFALRTSGAKHVYAGHSLYLIFSGTRTSGNPDNVYISASGLPTGVTFSFPDVEKTCCGGVGGYFLWSVTESFDTSVKLSIPESLPSGPYTVTLTSQSNGLLDSLPVTFTVTPAPLPVVKLPSTSFNQVAGLPQYEQQMTQYGQSQLCDEAQITAGGMWEGNAWYYDGTRVAYQIAEYTNNDNFKTCATYPRNVYRPYVVNNGGGIPGWRNFAKGFRLDYEHTGDEVSKQAALALVNASYGPNGITTVGLISEGLSREVAYAINTMLETEKLGQPRHARLAEYVDIALGHIDQWFVLGEYSRMAPFMFALTSEALIHYYEATADPRILPALKKGADWIWNHAWVASDRSFCYEYIPSAENNCSVGAPDLNLLVVPVYGWIYAQTGEASYIEKGDLIFLGGVEGAWLAQGKQFNQNYRWSMDYLRWRSQ
jgi:hypothetical protein